MHKLVKLTLWDHNKLHNEIGLVTGADSYKKELLLDTDTSIKRISFDKIQKGTMIDAED